MNARLASTRACMLLGCLALAGCTDHAPRMRVFASASLGAVFEELADACELPAPDLDVDVHTSGTPFLVLQIREGAGCDVFASADPAQMERVVALGKTAGAPLEFARNQLAIVTAEGNPHAVQSLADLARPNLTVALCGPQVPAGRYAREVLAKAGVTVRSVSDEPSVTAILSKVRLGQIDAGIVYASDAARARPLHLHVIREEHNVTTSCWIAPITTGRQPRASEHFVQFVRSPEGQRILASHGFSTP